MTRDEIINGLEREIKSIRRESQSKMLGVCITVDEAEDILSMLKEQETADTGKCRIFQCEKCGYGIEDIFVDEFKYQIDPRYCPNCGRKVKLDDI